MYILLLLFYVAITIPLRLGFGVEPQPWNLDFIVDIMVDCSFCVDIVANFRTAYLNDSGAISTRLGSPLEPRTDLSGLCLCKPERKIGPD